MKNNTQYDNQKYYYKNILRKLIRILYYSLISTFMILINLNYSLSNDVFVVIMQKQQAKQNTSWNLVDWMLTKKRIALMDQWLALNTSANIFEFMAYGSNSEYKYKEANTSSSIQNKFERGGAGAYASILGLESEYEKSNESSETILALAALRLIGTSSQGTNLSLEYGMKKFDFSNEEFKNQFYGAHLTLYLLSFLGIEGKYRNYLKDSSSLSRDVTGFYREATGFIDISFFRIFGSLFKESLYFEENSIKNKDVRYGKILGLKLFF